MGTTPVGDHDGPLNSTTCRGDAMGDYDRTSIRRRGVGAQQLPPSIVRVAQCEQQLRPYDGVEMRRPRDDMDMRRPRNGVEMRRPRDGVFILRRPYDSEGFL